MKKFLIRLIGWILSLAVIAGGAYLSYLTSDFDEFEADVNNVIAQLESMGSMFGGGETTPENGGETTPEDGSETTPENGGETTPEDGGETNPEEGGESVNPENQYFAVQDKFRIVIMEKYSIRFWGLLICILLVAVVIFIISTDINGNGIWTQIEGAFKDVFPFLSNSENDVPESTNKNPSDYSGPFLDGGSND